MSVPLAVTYRGAHCESVHRGSIAIVDSLGRTLAFAGDPSTVVCLRSAAKPFQAIPLLEYGGAEEYQLTAEEVALTCASHGGEPVHVAGAAALLRKGEFDESDLLCGAHEPYDERAAAELRASGEPPSALHNNCSGKHAGMLLASQAMDAPSSCYIDPDHPVQRAACETLAAFSGVGDDDIPTAVDGCGAPAYFLSLQRIAFAYARLMATHHGIDAPGSVASYAESAQMIVASMTGSPHFVAGNWSITTPLMAAFHGGLLAKEGAEGLYAMAISPALHQSWQTPLDVAEGVSIGVALKIDDGSMTRGRNPVILRTLELLGAEVPKDGGLQPFRDLVIRNVVGRPVGEVRSSFELEFF